LLVGPSEVVVGVASDIWLLPARSDRRHRVSGVLLEKMIPVWLLVAFVP